MCLLSPTEFDLRHGPKTTGVQFQTLFTVVGEGDKCRVMVSKLKSPAPANKK